MEHIVKNVLENSIAEELEIEPGDNILAVNDHPIEDIFDYQYLINDEYIELLVKKSDGEEWLLEIEKDYDEDLGIVFENSLMDNYKSCYNKCIFCFIDQNPKGMRDTIYFKDDDSRLSFLQGNYITLTNMKDEDIDRIINYHLAPINISVHTTNPQLRCSMLNNRFAGTILERIRKFYNAGIPMNGQIVLCKGINDGEELWRSISDLMEFVPVMESLSVVPVGLSDYRDGLFHLEPFDKEDACEVIDIIEHFQKKAYEKHGIHFVQASDEWYINAGRDFPEAERYDGFVQLENGVGMVRLMKEEFEQELSAVQGDDREYEVSIVTGVLVYDSIKILVDRMKEKFPNVKIHLYKIINDFFGHRITVTGLLTGGDMIKQLKGKPLGQRLILPSNTLMADEPKFLDDVTLDQFIEALQVDVCIVESSGADFIHSVIGDEMHSRFEK
ncbi:putative FeS-containing Cyanobacterial-specific oxidoreductase [Coprococcus eutactus CAG:665]|nr:putative FeS-containing Cyanobacterial-specific oxidoreductase [Coprococcus eutactus CAG:665]